MSDANKIAKHKDPRYDKKINKKNKKSKSKTTSTEIKKSNEIQKFLKKAKNRRKIIKKNDSDSDDWDNDEETDGPTPVTASGDGGHDLMAQIRKAKENKAKPPPPPRAENIFAEIRARAHKANSQTDSTQSSSSGIGPIGRKIQKMVNHEGKRPLLHNVQTEINRLME